MDKVGGYFKCKSNALPGQSLERKTAGQFLDRGVHDGHPDAAASRAVGRVPRRKAGGKKDGQQRGGIERAVGNFETGGTRAPSDCLSIGAAAIVRDFDDDHVADAGRMEGHFPGRGLSRRHSLFGGSIPWLTALRTR